MCSYGDHRYINSYVEQIKFRLDQLRDGQLEALLYPRMHLRNICEAPQQSVEPGTRQRSRIINELVSDLDFSPDGLLLAASSGNCLTLYDPQRGRSWKNLWNPMKTNSTITGLVFTGDKKFAVADVNGSIGVFDARKFTVPLNVFRAHSQLIQSLNYDASCEWLISTDSNGLMQYQYLPAFEISGVDLQKDLHYGTLLTCPVLNQFAIGFDTEKKAQMLVMCSKNNGSLYIVDNLDMRNLENDLRSIRFDDSLKLHLSMSPALAAPNRRNRIRMIDQDEYLPGANLSISKFAQALFFPHSSVLLLKFTTKKKSLLGMETKDWLSCVKVVDTRQSHSVLLKSYGANVLNETLLFVTEEVRFATLRDKKASITQCHRIIASPTKEGIRLLSFSPHLPALETVLRRKHLSSDVMSMFWPTGPEDMYTVATMPSTNSFPLTCKFSPANNLLLAVGDNDGQVLFYQPKL